VRCQRVSSGTPRRPRRVVTLRQHSAEDGNSDSCASRCAVAGYGKDPRSFPVAAVLSIIAIVTAAGVPDADGLEELVAYSS